LQGTRTLKGQPTHKYKNRKWSEKT
jgi:hypothetical protein